MSPVQASAPRALVGRAAELSVLDRRVAEAAGGRGGLVFIAGEPGIGKSRLAEEAGRRAYGRGCRVVWGRCRETEGAPPFWPWTQVLRGLLGDTRGGDLGDLGPLLEGGARAPEAADRFRLFDAVLALLSECADRQPLVLILDDLHRADSASLLLLDFVAPALRDRAVLLVGTLRTTEIAPALFAVVGERAADAEVLALTGLGVTDIGRLADALAPADARLSAEDLHRRSDGNPFFVTELLRLGPESGESVPATVGAAIAARVRRLPEATRRILTMAAVAGRDFRPAVLAVLDGSPVLWVEERLEPAVAGGLVHADPHGLPDYRFTHVLVRDALYQAIPPAQRALWHGRMVDVLSSATEEGPAALSDLASHAARAVRSPADRRRAVLLATAAGADARDRLAHEEAAGWFERALDLGDGGPDERFALLMEMGRCAGRAARLQACRSAFEQAWQTAVAERRGDRLAEVALALGAVVDSAGTVDAGLVRMLEESLEQVDPADRLTRIRLTARLAVAVYWGARLPEARRLASDAVAAARRLGDRRALAVALAAQQYALRGPGHLAERTRLGTELVEHAHRLGDEQLEIEARRFLLADRWQVAPASADADLRALDVLAERTRRPMARWYVMVNEVTRATLAGHPETALEMVDRTEAFGRRIGAHPAAMYAVAQRFFLLREFGRGVEAEEGVRGTVLAYPRVVTFRCTLAVLLAEAGRREEAAALLSELVADDCRAIPPDALWLHSLAQLALAAARLHRTADAETLRRLLLPHAGAVVFQGVVVWWGAVDHYLGALESTLGRWQEAERLLRAGLRLHEAWAAVPLVRASLNALDVVHRRGAEAGAGSGPDLTERERQVLRLLADGAANKQIARRLAISVHTVERHVTHVYSKIGAHNRAEATAFALRLPD